MTVHNKWYSVHGFGGIKRTKETTVWNSRIEFVAVNQILAVKNE